MTPKALESADSNFDAVPNEGLVVCCYWEYARESVFIRDVRRRCLDPKWKTELPSELWKYCGDDIARIQSIGHPADVILRGFFFDELEDRRPSHPDAPRITGSFPDPWLSLSPGERKYRSRIENDIEFLGLKAFARANWSCAGDLMKQAELRRDETIEANRKAHEQHPGVSEYYLRKCGILKDPPKGISVFWADNYDEPHREITMVEIEWANFTNEQIIQCFRKWVAANRPPDIAKPHKRGHKPKDSRANLTRLAVLRLLGQFTALQIVGPRKDKFPAVWKSKQFCGNKWQDVMKWHDARREARKVFHSLFPFLPKEEKPLSWERRPSRK